MDAELKIPRSIAYVFTHANEDHVCQTCRGPPGAKTMTYCIARKFHGLKFLRVKIFVEAHLLKFS